MNVLTIVESWLRQNGFDGLYEPDAVCACKVGHLAPCGDLGQHCIPGHVAPCPPECGEGCEFHIVGTQVGWEIEGHSAWATENECEVCDRPLLENMDQPPVRRLGEEER